MTSNIDYHTIAETIHNARAMIVTAGSGMGVDSGIPDFKGGNGFWDAYPQYRKMGVTFADVADFHHLMTNPHSGWGFYGQRANLYRKLEPHKGFSLLLEWAKRYNLDTFVVTTNVDCQFQKAGFKEDQVLEVHGTVHHLQCSKPCSKEIWENVETFDVNEETMRISSYPTCPKCGAVARPNILMYGSSMLYERVSTQEDNYEAFMERNGEGPTVVIEIGAGTWVPTMRQLSERLGRRSECKVIRINPGAPHISAPHFSCAAGALTALQSIENALQQL